MEISKATFVVFGEGIVMGRRVADVNTREATELKMTAGSETETAGVTGKSKETEGSEVAMVAGMEGGEDTEVGMDSKSTADRSRAVVGAEASVRCAIDSGGYRYWR